LIGCEAKKELKELSAELSAIVLQAEGTIGVEDVPTYIVDTCHFLIKKTQSLSSVSNTQVL